MNDIDKRFWYKMHSQHMRRGISGIYIFDKFPEDERRQPTILCAMLRTKAATGMTKKQLVDNAIAYADMLTRRLEQIPEDAQQRAENGRDYERVDWDEIERIAENNY